MHVKMMGHSAVQTSVNPTTASNLLCERLEEDLHLSMEASRRAPALLTSLFRLSGLLIVTKSTDGENEVLSSLTGVDAPLAPWLDPTTCINDCHCILFRDTVLLGAFTR